MTSVSSHQMCWFLTCIFQLIWPYALCGRRLPIAIGLVMCLVDQTHIAICARSRFQRQSVCIDILPLFSLIELDPGGTYRGTAETL